MKNTIELSIIFPVHNESQGIKDFLKKVYSLFKKQDIQFEVICIENGSTDNSFEILKNLEKKYKNLSIFQSEKGWGNAVREGIFHAKGKYICYMVSDGQVDPKYITVLYNKIRNEHASMAKIVRITRENTTRLVNSRLYNLLASILFGLQSMDINGTPKIIKSSYVKHQVFTSKNIAFDLELLLKMKRQNISWIEIPVHSQKRKTGFSTTNFKSVWEMFHYMMKFKFSKK